MHNNYKEGFILTSAGVNDGITFLTGLDMKNFVTEGNGAYWTESLKNPYQNVSWIILRLNYDDAQNIRNTLLEFINSKSKLEDYKLMFANPEIEIYQCQAKGYGATQAKEIAVSKIIQKVDAVSACQFTAVSGDTLWKIAKKTYGHGVDYRKLVEINDITYYGFIRTGQELVIPCPTDI